MKNKHLKSQTWPSSPKYFLLYLVQTFYNLQLLIGLQFVLCFHACMSNLEFLRHHERISIQTPLFKLVMWLELKQKKIQNKILRHSFWIASWKKCWWLLFLWKYVTILLSTYINTSQKSYEDPYIFHKSPNWLNRLHVMHKQFIFVCLSLWKIYWWKIVQRGYVMLIWGQNSSELNF